MPEKKHVLIICRTAAGQMYLGVLLNRLWYSPVLAKTPEEGIRIAQTTGLSLILFDADISQSELASAVSLLRTHPSFTGIPLVVFMTEASADTNEMLLSQGCSAILTKPLDLAIVHGVLGRLSGQPRSTFRVPVKMRVEIEEGTPEKFLTCINVSEGGLYLRSADPLPGGEVLHVTFTLPHDSEPIKVAAEVVRSLRLGTELNAEPGMGLRFLDISEDTLSRIRNFVQWEMMGDLEWKATI